MFCLTKNSETESASARSEDSRIMCPCKCGTKQWTERKCRDSGTFSMYVHNQPLCLRDCQSSPLSMEQREASASVVCIHLNLEPKAKHSSPQKSQTLRHGQRCAYTPKLSWKSTSPTRRKLKSSRGSDLPSPSRPRSTASSSSRHSDSFLQEDNLGNSKIQTSATDSTSASSRAASPRPGILQQQHKRTSTRRKSRTTSSRSPSESSKTDSSGVNISDEKEKYNRPTRRKKATFERSASKSKRTGKKHIPESSLPERRRSKSSRKYKRSSHSRTGSSRRRKSRSSSFSSGSSRSSVSWEHNLPDTKTRRSFRKSSGHVVSNPVCERNEAELSSGGKERKSSGDYLQDNLQDPQLCCVDYDSAKEICRKCRRVKQRSDCLSDVCTGIQKNSPACLVCSRCYIIPCSSTERVRQVVTSGSKKPGSPKYAIKTRKRDRHSRKRAYKPRRDQIPARGEWTQNHTAVSSGSSLSSTRFGEQIVPNRSSEYYQCDLLLGQCSTPTSATVTAPHYINPVTAPHYINPVTARNQYRNTDNCNNSSIK